MPDRRGDPIDGSDLGPGAEHTPRIGLGIDRRRDRELLSGLLSAYEVRILEGTDVEGIDLCIVDPEGFERLATGIERWKADERPAAAPALLLADAPEPAIWEEYADAMGRGLDAIQSIPVPKRAILARVRGLLETRRYSRAAKRRHERLELYERAMESADVGITIADATDPELPLVYVNDAFEEITGYSSGEVLGWNCRFLQGEETEGATVDRIREALEAEEPVSVEIRNYRRCGEPFWNDLDIVPVTDESGAVTHFLGFQADVTERRARELDLERYKRVFQSIDDPALVVDTAGHLELSNAAAAALFGDGAAVPDGAEITELFPPEAREVVREALTRVGRSGEPRERQITVPDAENRARTYQFRFQPERLTADRPRSRTIVIGRDVTTLREYQNRLSVLDRVLRHNLRNKLTVIDGNTDLLAEAVDELSAETAAESVAAIDAAVGDLLDLAEAARQFNRSIRPGDGTGSPVPIGTLLEETVAAARRRYPDARIRVDTTAATTAICPATIRLCLDQILENAVVHADSASPTVEVAVRDRPVEGYTEIRIADDGPGMPEREREALRRGAETPLEHLQGISLWLTSWAVRGVGGDVRIEDNEPTGTVVALRLPRADR